jgi:putative heme transporter
VLVVAVIASVVVWQRRPLVAIATGALALCKRLTGRPRTEGEVIVRSLLSRLKTVHLGLPDILGAMGWAMANWCLDCGCLICSFAAVGAAVPWRGLLLAYGAAQLASNLPITPGGLGVVEGSMTIALVTYGGVEISNVAAVVLYRIISFWGYLPVGWAAWGGVTLANRRRDRRSAAAGLPRLPAHDVAPEGRR